MIRENKVKKTLKAGGNVIGTFLKIHDPLVIEVLGLAGLDFVIVDNEHVSMSKESMVSLIRGAEVTDIAPVIRVRENTSAEILQALDAGALGVQIPNVDTLDDAQKAVRSAKYFPNGNRGFSPGNRSAAYGMMDKSEYIKLANENTLLVYHCESVTSMNNLDEILKLEDLDVLFIGPEDLSQSLGIIGESNHPKLLESIETIINKVRAAGKAVGLVAPNAVKAKELMAKGVQYIAISTDQGMVASFAKNLVSELK